jgi:hypothetical protein
MKKLQLIKVLCTAGALVAAVTTAQATVIGSLWENTTAWTATSYYVPSGTPNVTFSAPGVNFSSFGPGLLTGNVSADYTVGPWLGTGGATGVSYAGGAASSDSMDNTIVQLTGSLYLSAGANSFNITHDDGININISGLGNVLNDTGPTAPVTTPFTVTAATAGTYNFTVDYQEIDGPPAVLMWTYPTGGSVGVPDSGSTIMLLGAALSAITLLRRKLIA